MARSHVAHTVTLTQENAVQAWLMYHAGRYLHEIAACFGCNSRKIWEILHELKFPESRQRAAEILGIMPDVPARRPNPRAKS